MVSGTTIKPIAANPAHSAHRMWDALVERRAIIGAFFMCVLGPVVLPMLQVGQPRVAVIIAAGFAVSALVTFWGHESAPALDRAYAGEVSSLSEPEFDLLEDFVEREATSIGRERMAREKPGESHVPDAFETLVAEALDDLPEFMQCILADNVAVLVGDDGREGGAYGLYVGTTVTTATASTSTATRSCATSATIWTRCEERSRSRCATSWRTISAPTSAMSPRSACSTRSSLNYPTRPCRSTRRRAGAVRTRRARRGDRAAVRRRPRPAHVRQAVDRGGAARRRRAADLAGAQLRRDAQTERRIADDLAASTEPTRARRPHDLSASANQQRRGRWSYSVRI